MLLLYVDDVLLFANTLGDPHTKFRISTKAYEGIGRILHAKLSVNDSKIKIMLVKSEKHINHALCTIMSHLNVWKASNILALFKP